MNFILNTVTTVKLNCNQDKSPETKLNTEVGKLNTSYLKDIDAVVFVVCGSHFRRIERKY